MDDTANKTERFEMRLAVQDLAALDKLRKDEPDLPPRSEMVRRLIERASERKSRK